MKFHTLILIFCLCALFTGCASLHEPEQETEQIKLLFGGDIMAHKPNFNMKNYSKIWDGIRTTVQEADLAFANIEAPVADSLPYSSYPNFNMHGEYPEQAIEAGFNVFSLINNHSNDQGLKGIQETYEWAEKTEKKFAENGKPVYFSGLKKEADAPLECRVINKNGWKILFCAITEILNRPDYRTYLNYVASTKKSREAFIEKIHKFKEENSCDIFIISIHSDEPEYISEISESRRKFYHSLVENGVDVVWANHPHIPREKEFIGNKATQRLEKAIIYGNGNLISGQRWEPDFENPENPRDNTGDGYLLEMTFEKDLKNDQIRIIEHKTHYITTYINSNWEFIIKKLDDEFIQYLSENKRPKWSEYIRHRKKITERTKETITWQ